MPIRVFIVDDHDVIRSGMRNMLESSGIEVCGESSTLVGLMDAVADKRPDVLLLDVRVGEDDGLQLVSPVRALSPPVNVLIFSAHDNPTHEAKAYTDGANGYLYKSATMDQLVDSVRRGHGGIALATVRSTATYEFREGREAGRRRACSAHEA
ncbi:MAG: response regulator transcription factor [Pirellulales bacterium]